MPPEDNAQPHETTEAIIGSGYVRKQLDQVEFTPPQLVNPAEAMPPGNPVSEAPQASAPSTPPVASDE
jgi:hypothetical protein